MDGCSCGNLRDEFWRLKRRKPFCSVMSLNQNCFSHVYDSAHRYSVQAFTTVELNFDPFLLVLLLRENNIMIIWSKEPKGTKFCEIFVLFCFMPSLSEIQFSSEFFLILYIDAIFYLIVNPKHCIVSTLSNLPNTRVSWFCGEYRGLHYSNNKSTVLAGPMPASYSSLVMRIISLILYLAIVHLSTALFRPKESRNFCWLKLSSDHQHKFPVE